MIQGLGLGGLCGLGSSGFQVYFWASGQGSRGLGLGGLGFGLGFTSAYGDCMEVCRGYIEVSRTAGVYTDMQGCFQGLGL